MPLTHDKTGRTLNRSGDIMAAPGGSTTQFRRRNRIGEQFAARVITMLEAPAYRVLSLSGRRVLDRIEIELAHHGGRDNGKLPVTFDDFQKYGIDRHAIAPGMREVEALGFVQVTERGRAGNAEYRTPNKFRLTYRPTEQGPPTDEWRRIKTIDEAKALALAARKPIRRERPANGTAKKQKPVGVNTSFSVGNPHRKAQPPVGETLTTGKVGKAPPPSIFRGGARARRSTDGKRAGEPSMAPSLTTGALRT